MEISDLSFPVYPVKEHQLIEAYMELHYKTQPCLVIYNPWDDDPYFALMETDLLPEGWTQIIGYADLLIRPLSSTDEGVELCTKHHNGDFYIQVWNGWGFVCDNLRGEA